MTLNRDPVSGFVFSERHISLGRNPTLFLFVGSFLSGELDSLILVHSFSKPPFVLYNSGVIKSLYKVNEALQIEKVTRS